MDGWNFIRLVHALRQVSLSISSQDILDAQTCLFRFPGLSEKQVVKSIFIHRPQDASIFEAIWRILIENPEGRIESFPEDRTKVPVIDESQDSSGLGGQGVGRGSGGVSLTSKGSILDTANISTLVPFSRLEELTNGGFELEEMVKKVLAELDYYTWINSYDLAYQRSELTEESWYIHQDRRSALISEIRQQLLTAQVSHENSWEPLVRQHWLYKSLSTLTDKEKELVKSSIRKWARKLAVRPGSRWKSSHRGTIDISRIVQQSVQRNGFIFNLNYHQRVPRASELVVLCDVSNSMASFVEFLIYLVTCLRARFRKIRVFFFIDSVWDVSEFVCDDDLSGVKQEIKSSGDKVSSGFSDYGAVFREMAENRLRDVSTRATLIILGDGKNNYRPTQTEYLAQISEKVRNVFWLNPLEIQEWNERDNMMNEYKNYCSKVYRCRSASDLHRIVQDVF
ncbi:VWA domain containing CoxE-like family protein [Candidatus Desulfosporosinus infrequens]|uniref:VWA domain containing CoxE-like family protein n=1 Tax=Candidatus Desulfosporosinus infrequens TaxID=2043169 RepID=A0A2U3KIB2_9FIRM|nr:VWA domain containing CoxE-like family protein [Candidatus Desulfosporosinus infrequens]